MHTKASTTQNQLSSLNVLLLRNFESCFCPFLQVSPKCQGAESYVHHGMEGQRNSLRPDPRVFPAQGQRSPGTAPC